jgi:hypothetical protein
MAIPIRLVGGVNGEVSTDLVAQKVEVNVDRNVSAFPTPNNILKRFAVDTNIPRITVEIDGILIDDEGLGVDATGVTTNIETAIPNRILINFGSIMPTEPFSPFSPVNLAYTNIVSGGVRKTTRAFPAFTNSTFLRKGATNTLVNLTGSGNAQYKAVAGKVTNRNVPIRVGLKFSGAHSIGATGPLTVASNLSLNGVTQTISDNTDKLAATALLNIGDRVVKSDGTFLGLVAALTTTSITFASALTTTIGANEVIYVTPKAFNSRNEFVGYVTEIKDMATGAVGSLSEWRITLSDNNEAELVEGDVITVNQSNNSFSSILDGEAIKLIPSYWLEDRTRSPPRGRLSSSIDFLASDDDNHRLNGIRLKFNSNKTSTLLGGSDLPTVLHTATNISRAGTNIAASDRGDSQYHDAIIDVPIGGLVDTADSNPAVNLAKVVEQALTNGTLLSTNISSTKLTPTNDKTLTDVFDVERKESVIILTQKYVAETPIAHPEVFTARVKALFNPQVFQSDGTFSTLARHSAGDKAQNLIGLVSNADKAVDLFRGIQIPYDSLITSSGINGVARNFFLTFGNVPASEKGSLSNTRAASASMNNLILDASAAGGNIADAGTREKGLLEGLIDYAIPESIQTFTGFLTSAAKDMWVGLGDRSVSRRNDGGIRIIPEKLHVRYDAGNNYYAFNLVLVATDFVIGV